MHPDTGPDLPSAAAPARTLASRLGLEQTQIATRMVDVNDGIVATAGIVEGFSGAGISGSAIVLAAAAAMVAGALALAGAKYAEAASERDVQRAILAHEQHLLDLSPDEELAELAELYRARGLRPELARQVAEELTATDALTAHAEAEYGIATTLASPFATAVGAGLSFAIGAAVPLSIVVVAPAALEGIITLVAVLLALTLTSAVISRIGRTRLWPELRRAVLIGSFAVGVSWLGGHLFTLD